MCQGLKPVAIDRDPVGAMDLADGDGENVGELFQRVLDPFSAAERGFAQQESASQAGPEAVIPASYGAVDDVRAGHRRGRSSFGDRRKLPKLPACATSAMGAPASPSGAGRKRSGSPLIWEVRAKLVLDRAALAAVCKVCLVKPFCRR
jgi:hypothetical protein